MVILLVAAVSLAQASRTAADPETFQLAAGLAGGAAVAVLLVLVLKRR
jgi:hypothetical protein